MILSTLGWFLAGAFLAGCLVHFWDDIKEWLNTVAADAVERAFGYNARACMHRAIATVDRFMSKLKNTSVVYSKKNPSDLYFDKTTIRCEMNTSEVDEDVWAEFDKNNNRLIQEFVYRH